MTPLTWLITGCSSGFGEQFVHSILARGDKVIATGRKAEQRLAHLKGTGAAILDLDLSAPEAEIQAKAEEALKIYDGIDVLVNNAGYVDLGFVEDFNHDRWINQMQVKLLGPAILTRAIIPHMREKRSGTIVNIGSIFGWEAQACTPAYNASNAALRTFTENLQVELGQFNVRAVIFEPGHFRTKILDSENVRIGLSKHEDYQPMLEILGDQVAANKGNQPGDPKLGVERMIDVVKSEGLAQGRPMPATLPLGSDAFDIIRRRCLDTIKICDEWEALIKSTDFAKGNVDGTASLMQG